MALAAVDWIPGPVTVAETIASLTTLLQSDSMHDDVCGNWRRRRLDNSNHQQLLEYSYHMRGC